MIFVDSGAWIALLDPRDQHHNAAIVVYERLILRKAPIVTTDYVIDETITRLRYDSSHSVAVSFFDFVSRIEQQGLLTIVSINNSLFQEAQRLFRRFDSARLSFTDCTNFVVCRKNKISEAFAFDEHFSIMGIALLR